MSEDPKNSDQDFSDLEKHLGRLAPQKLDASFESGLSRRMNLVETDQDQEQKRAMWVRFAPVAAMSVAVLFIVLGVQSQWRQSHGAGDSPESAFMSLAENESLGELVAGERKERPVDSFQPRVPSAAASPEVDDRVTGEFLPVSHQNYLRRAADAGIFDTGTATPARGVRLEFEDAYHWHDPDTQTNIRVFRPREEFILVPVETD